MAPSNPTTVPPAAMNAFRKIKLLDPKKIFPGLYLLMCFFHLCQSLQKRISKNFKKEYRTDKAFAKSARLVVFLAFVPEEKVDDAFYEVSYHIVSK